MAFWQSLKSYNSFMLNAQFIKTLTTIKDDLYMLTRIIMNNRKLFISNLNKKWIDWICLRKTWNSFLTFSIQTIQNLIIHENYIIDKLSSCKFLENLEINRLKGTVSKDGYRFTTVPLTVLSDQVWIRYQLRISTSGKHIGIIRMKNC